MKIITAEISLNDNVMVKLTNHGKQVLDEYRRKAEEDVGGEIKHAYRYDLSGRYTGQLWHIIKVFGSYISLGEEDVFEDNKIYAVEDL